MYWLIVAICSLIQQCSGSENLRKQVNKMPIYIINYSQLTTGYRKSLSSYFYKQNNRVDNLRDIKGGVRAIFRSMLGELMVDPDKKFILNNALYFQLYYENSNQNIKDRWRSLINADQQRLEVVGSYTEIDENNAYWDDLIDSNMMAGEFWRKKFNKTVSIGWQVNNPGYSAGYLSLLYQMGIKLVFINRIDYQDKQERQHRNKHNTDGNVFIFAPEQQDRDSPVLCYLLDSNSFPIQFDFDINQEDTINNEPIKDIDHAIMNTEINIEKRSYQFLKQYYDMKINKNSSQVLQLLGGEFSLQSSGQIYENFDKLIAHINAKSKYNTEFKHILPNEWLDIIYRQVNDPNNYLEVKRQDFAINRENANNYQSGIFSTRTNFKYIVKDYSLFLNQVRNILGNFYLKEKEIKVELKDEIKQKKGSLYLIENKQKVLESLYGLEQAVSLSNSHHGISGSSYKSINDEYKQILSNSRTRMMGHLQNHIRELFNEEYDEQIQDWIRCDQNDTLILSCPMLNFRLKYGRPVVVGVYNQLQYETMQVMKIKVNSRQIVISNSQNVELKYQEVFCMNPFDESDCELYFVDTLKKQSFSFYRLKESVHKIREQKRFDFKRDQKERHTIKTSDVNFVQIDGNLEKLIYSFCQKKDINDNGCDRIEFRIEVGEYEGWESSDNGQKDSNNYNSGYYVLHIKRGYKFEHKKYEKGTLYMGSMMSKLYLYSEQASVQTIITFYSNVFAEKVDNVIDWKKVDIEHMIRPLDVAKHAKEMVCKIEIDGFTQHNQVFYTDRNGLELQKRQENKREGYELDNQAKLEQNIYPVTSILQVRNIRGQKVSLISDRVMGMGLVGGKIEMVLQRGFKDNDGMGINQGMQEQDQYNDEIKVKQSFVLVFQLYRNELQNHRKLQFYRDNPVMILIAKSEKQGFDKTGRSYLSQIQQFGINNKMVKVQYLPRRDNTVLMRVFNNFEDQHQQFISPFEYIKELSLQGSMSIDQLNELNSKYSLQNVKLKDNQKLNDNKQIREYQQDLVDRNVVGLMPLQIRTFLVGDRTSWAKFSELKDDYCDQYLKYYQEIEEEQFLELDLSVFGNNATNYTIKESS